MTEMPIVRVQAAVARRLGNTVGDRKKNTGDLPGLTPQQDEQQQ
jgi:hypothetical protein